MNYTIVKIAASDRNDDDEYLQQSRGPSHFIKTEAFTVLPPLSPQIPGPPPTPSPYRILPPIVSRKRPSFVIIQELGSRPQSREPSPSGRVSPFRGCGFKPSSASREPSPSRPDEEDGQEDVAEDDKAHQSRSRLPVAQRKTPTRKVSKSASPARPKSSGIPVPLGRRISCSPNRAKEILAGVNDKLEHNNGPKPLRSSENLLGRRPTVSESDLKSALRKSSINGRRLTTSSMGTTFKPPVPQKSKTSIKFGSKPKSPSGKMSNQEAKKSSSTTSSPAKRNLYLGKNETLKKENAAKDIVVKSSPTRPKTLPKSPSKFTSVKSKENLSPCSNPPPPMKMIRTLSKMTKTPSRPPARTPIKEPAKPTTAAKVEQTAASKPEDCGMHCDIKSDVTRNVTTTTTPSTSTPTPTAFTAATPTSTTTSTPATTTKEMANGAEKNSKPLKVMAKRVGRKALTTGNLMAAWKKSEKESKEKSDETSDEVKVDERKDLPHMDTTRSLPISIGTTNMTDSSVTLIRTTTEPALAPVEPELITEIRSALNDAKIVTDETFGILKEVKNVSAADPIVESVVSDNEAVTISEDVKRNNIQGANQFVESTKIDSTAVLESQSKSSPHPVHVIAVTKIEEPKQEMTSTIVEIKQEADNEVQSVNTSNQSENRNGISKSSWLNERPQAETMRKLSVRKLKENPSTESLMSNSKATRWQRFKSKCPKCFRRAPGTHPLQISTITKTAAEPSDTIGATKGHSCLRKYLFCVRCERKMSGKGKKAVEDSKRQCIPQMKCFRLKNNFKNVFDKWPSCKRKKNESPTFSAPSHIADTEVACVGPQSGEFKTSLCGRCSSKFFSCFGILCCVNSAFCVKMRSKCKNLCSCCKKCVCCGDRKKKDVTEAERRKSTISMPRKRKWTRILTDFPKLDASFVEHGSIMRGAIPVLPVPLAWICLILNVFLPGFGTLSSGIFCLFIGKPRFSINDSIFARIGAFVVNLLVAGSQLFTVLFCLVGWGWSIWWGVMMLKMARKNKRIVLAEQGTTATHLSLVTAKTHDAEKGTVSNG